MSLRELLVLIIMFIEGKSSLDIGRDIILEERPWNPGGTLFSKLL
jgi:hypothetical protein